MILARGKKKILSAKFKYRGQTIWRSLHTRDKRIAQIRYAEELKKIGSTPEGDMPWGDFCRKYTDRCIREGFSPSTLENDERTVRFFNEIIPIKLLSEFNRDSVEYFIKYKIEKGTTPATVNRYLDTLKAMGKWAENRDILEFDPLRKVQKLREIKPAPKPFTDEEMEKIRNSFMDEFDEIFVELGYYTGRRLSEVLRMKRSQIDWGKRIINTSGQSSRLKREGVVPLHPVLAQKLKRWYETCPNGDYVLELSGRPLNRGYASKLMSNRICKRAGVKGHYHRLRHTFLTRLSENDMNLKKIGAMAGHSSISTTQGYVAPKLESLREVFEKSL